MDLTKEYFDEQLKTLVTKQDAKNFATNDDLKHFLTKEDLDARFEILPTKEDFHNLQTSVDRIAQGYETTEEELHVVRERTSRIEAWIQKAANKIGSDYKP